LNFFFSFNFQGSFTTVASITVNRIFQYDGQSTISALGTGTNDTVQALAWHASTSSLIVGGLFANAGGISGTTGIARWTGVVWEPLMNGFKPGARINAIAIDPTTNYIFAGKTKKISLVIRKKHNLNTICRWFFHC